MSENDSRKRKLKGKGTRRAEKSKNPHKTVGGGSPKPPKPYAKHRKFSNPDPRNKPFHEKPPKVQYPSHKGKFGFTEPAPPPTHKEKIIWDPEARQALRDIQKVLNERDVESKVEKSDLDKLDVENLTKLLEITNDPEVLEKLLEKQLEEVNANETEPMIDDLENEPQNIAGTNAEPKTEHQESVESYDINEPSVETPQPIEHDDYETYLEYEADALNEYLKDIENPSVENSVELTELNLDQIEDVESENELIEPDVEDVEQDSEPTEGY